MAAEVKILSVNIPSIFQSSFVCSGSETEYTLSVKSGDKEYRITRRERDLKNLDKELKAEHSALFGGSAGKGKRLKLPPTGTFGIRKRLNLGSFNVDRRNGIQAYLTKVCSHFSSLDQVPCLLKFLEDDASAPDYTPGGHAQLGGYAQPGGYVQPGGYTQPGGYIQPEAPDGYAQPGGYTQPGGYVQPEAPDGYAQPGGYTQPGGYVQPEAPDGYAQPGGYAHPGGYSHGPPQRTMTAAEIAALYPPVQTMTDAEIAARNAAPPVQTMTR